MSDAVFVDSNILIYAHDADAGAKRDSAVRLLERLWDTGAGRVSVQVLQEFYVNATRKLSSPVDYSTAREVVRNYGVWVREPTTPDTVTRAIDLAQLARLSFWDALIIASAEQAACTTLMSEDLSAGQAIAGIEIVNPFRSA